MFFDTAGLAEGTPLTFKAVVRDAFGNLDSDTGTAVVGAVEPPPSGGGTPDYAVVHYLRPAADYDGWGFHFWGDIDQTVEWTSPVPLAGEDAYGPFAWVKLLPNADEVGFIPHKGDEKDPGPDRFFNPSQNPEIWLKQGDLTVYTSQAAAQGYADDPLPPAGRRVHRLGPPPVGRRHRPERGHRVGDTQAADRHPTTTGRTGPSSSPIRRSPLNFIIHKGDEKDTADRTRASLRPTSRRSGSSRATRRSTRPAARPRTSRSSTTTAPTATTATRRRRTTTTSGASTRGPATWTRIRSGRRRSSPPGTDRFGAFFKLDLDADATELAYILHRGDTKDPGPDQFLDLVNIGHEVWYLSGHTDADQMAKYLLPIQAGSGVDADLSRQKAHWLTENTHRLGHRAAAGRRVRAPLRPRRRPRRRGRASPAARRSRSRGSRRGLPADLQAKWPHLATYQAFRIAADDLDAGPRCAEGPARGVRDRRGRQSPRSRPGSRSRASSTTSIRTTAASA